MGKLHFAVLIALMLCACAPSPASLNFKKAQQLLEQNQSDEAYPLLKEACAKSPDNEQFCAFYNDVRKKLYDRDLKALKNTIAELKEKNQFIPLKHFSDLSEAIRKLERYDLRTKDFSDLTASVAEEKQNSEGKLSGEMKKADKLFSEQKYTEALDTLNNISYLDPAAVTKKYSQYAEKALEELYPEIEKAVKAEDWTPARKLIGTALAIDPDYKNLKGLNDEIQTKDSADYYLKLAETERQAKNFDGALAHCNKALQYPEEKAKVAAAIYQIKMEYIALAFDSAVDFAGQELNRQAFDNFKKGFDMLDTLPPDKKKEVNVPKKQFQAYIDNLQMKAKKAEDAGNTGFAYNLYKVISILVPAHPQIREHLRRTEDKIVARTMKSLAVLPFKSSKSSQGSGESFGANIILALYTDNEIKNDLKIIERESMDAIMKEYELAVAGKGTTKDTSAFQISSADYLLMGDVLDSKVESTVQEGNKVERVKTGTEFQTNPEYDEWQKNISAGAISVSSGNMPPKQIEKPVYEDVRYRVTYYRKVGLISVNYRIVETLKGKILHTGLVDIKKEASDEANEGVDIGAFKKPFKIANLPTDSEILRKAQDEAITKITGDLKALFKDPEEKYLKQAESLEKENNLKDAVERYSDVLIMMKRKQKDIKEIEQKIFKYLDVL